MSSAMATTGYFSFPEAHIVAADEARLVNCEEHHAAMEKKYQKVSLLP